MALKFLNKKGWHTGSLRNIENVWKAEQKNDAEQKKLEELRKQIQEERERSEFRLLQEQAGLVPKQERLDFLYESGLAVGKGSSDGFQTLQQAPSIPETQSSAANKEEVTVPGALFEEKPHSVNDSWRKLHSDPLLLIRQREQEALARIKNNPVQMAMIRKSVETQKNHKEGKSRKKEKKKHSKRSKHDKYSSDSMSDSDKPSKEINKGKKTVHRSEEVGHHYKQRKQDTQKTNQEREESKGRNHESEEAHKHHRENSKYDKHHEAHEHHEHSKYDKHYKTHYSSSFRPSEDKHAKPDSSSHQASSFRRRPVAPKLTDEEREARLRQMQHDAKVHEQQRYKRLKKASQAEAEEADRANLSGTKNFLDDAQKKIYGTEQGGSSTIEESVRRKSYYLQGRPEAHERNAFRR